MDFQSNDELSVVAPVFESIDSIKVLVRVRPLSDKEVNEENESVVDILNEQTLKVTSLDGKRSFQCAFDAVLGPSASQAQVYDIVKSCTHSVLDGFNSTVFAYGQTGSGKVIFYSVMLFVYSLCLDLFDVRSSNLCKCEQEHGKRH